LDAFDLSVFLIQNGAEPDLRSCRLLTCYAAGVAVNLDALGNIGDFVGGIAVIATLIYLAVQVRQNTSALRTASRQEIVSGFREHNRLMFLPGVDDALLAGLRRYPDLPKAEKANFGNLINDHALFFQGVFALRESGTLEEETYEAYLQIFSA
jgi:hypothetical protein